MITVALDEFLPEHIDILQEEHPLLKNVILSSVKAPSPEVIKTLQNKCEIFIELDAHTPLPIENRYSTKNTLGKDRIAAAVGAFDLFPGKNLLVIDAGTALTYDIVNQSGQYLGGNISPGLDMRFMALHQFTGELPLVKQGQIDKFYGTSTEEAIRGGVQNGIIFEVDSTINAFKDYYTNLQVIITGGNADFFDKKLKNSFFVHLNLIALGLNRILEYNGEI